MERSVVGQLAIHVLHTLQVQRWWILWSFLEEVEGHTMNNWALELISTPNTLNSMCLPLRCLYMVIFHYAVYIWSSSITLSICGNLPLRCLYVVIFHYAVYMWSSSITLSYMWYKVQVWSMLIPNLRLIIGFARPEVSMTEMTMCV